MKKQVTNLIKTGSWLLVKPHGSIYSAALIIALTYGLSMVLGIFRDRLIVGHFYNCCRPSLDVYYAAFRLPDMVFQLVVIGALSAAFIPVFSSYLEKDKEESYRLASSVLNLLLIVFIVIGLIIFIFAQPLSTLITGNFTADQVKLMAQMTRVMLLAQFLFLISNFSAAMIQSHRRFLIPSLSPVVYNLGIIVAVLTLVPLWGIWAAVVGVVFGAVLHLLIQLPLLKKLGFKYTLVFDYRSKGVIKILKLMLPRTLALAAGQIEATVSLFLATSLSTGSLTLYYLAQKLSDVPVRIIGTSLGQAALPTLSTQIAQERLSEFKLTLRESLSQIFFLAMPVTGVFLVLRLQLVRLAYGSVTFPWKATIDTGQVMAAIVISIFSQSAIQLLARAFYSLSNTKTPLIISLISVLINITLSLIFLYIFQLEVFGLALAFTIANLINFVTLFLVFQLRYKGLVDRSLLTNWVKMIEASALASGVTWLSMKLLDQYIFDTTRVLPLVILTCLAVSLGGIVYWFVSWGLSVPELSVIKDLLIKIKKFRGSFFASTRISEPTSVT